MPPVSRERGDGWRHVAGDREAYGRGGRSGPGTEERTVDLEIARALQVEEDGEYRHAADRNGVGFEEQIAEAVQMITVRTFFFNIELQMSRALYTFLLTSIYGGCIYTSKHDVFSLNSLLWGTSQSNMQKQW